MAFGSVFRNFASVLRADGFAFRSRRKFGIQVINKTGSTIAVDKLVAISGYDTTTKLPKIVLADADAANLATDVYVTTKAVTNNGQALVFKGSLSAANLNTNSASAAGDPVYLSATAGAFTVTAPTDENSRVVIVGYVQVKSATVGQLAWDIQPPTKLANTDYASDTRVLAANATFTTTAALATLTGFTWTVVAAGVYEFEVNLPATMSTNGGLSVAFKYTTATLTSIQVQTYAATAADNTTAVSTQSTVTTDATKFFDSKAAAYTLVTLRGTLVVNAAGTIAVQAAQNTSHSDTTTVLLGAFARFTRVS